MTTSETIKLVEDASEYKYGFITDIEQEFAPKGLNEQTVNFISKKKKEPKWLLEWRLKAFKMWKKRGDKLPEWANLKYDNIDFQDIHYFAAPKSDDEKPNSLDEVDPELLRAYDKLGIPLKEQEFLAGIKNKTKKNPEDIAQKLSQKGLKRFLISLGEKGVFAYNDKIGKYYESELLSFKNDTGAGDALLAGLVHGHLKGWSWDYTIKFSLITANFALKVKETVNSNLNERDVLKVLEENYERRK